MKLSPHFTLEELTFSEIAAREGLDNSATPQIFAHLEDLAHGLEGVRDLLGGLPIRVSSGYRSPLVNAAAKGSKMSAHMDGYAADFTCPAFGTPKEIAQAIVESGLKFDQIIHEFGAWVHISFDPKMRRSVLTATRIGRDVVYETGIR